MQIANGLAAAHDKGIVHRDLKPDNLFVYRDGRVKILDFGLAKLAAKETPGLDGATMTGQQTAAGVVMGTASYMAPEQVRGGQIDARTDMFSFGVVLYEMLSGKACFQRDSAPETMTAILKEDPPSRATQYPVSPALERIVRRCLENHPINDSNRRKIWRLRSKRSQEQARDPQPTSRLLVVIRKNAVRASLRLQRLQFSGFW